MPPIEQVVVVNELVNRMRYAPDLETYGVAEHWAPPAQLFERKAGDSEDFAIAKYFMLRDLGFAPENLKLVIVHHPDMPEACFMQVRAAVGATTLVLTHRGAPRPEPANALPRNALFQIGHAGVLSTRAMEAEAIGGVW